MATFTDWQLALNYLAGQVSIAATNTDFIGLISNGTFTVTTNSPDQTNLLNRGVYVYIVTGTFGATASAIICTIQGKNPGTSNYYTILQSASLVASSFVALCVYPGATVAANLVASQPLPKSWRVQLSAANWGTGGSTVQVDQGLLI